MAINPIRSGSIGALQIPTGDSARTRDGGHGRADRTDANKSAIKVELSPAARTAAATSAVTNANRASASSSDFFASPEGQQALRSLSPRGARTSIGL
jgi:hypothetical protein